MELDKPQILTSPQPFKPPKRLAHHEPTNRKSASEGDGSCDFEAVKTAGVPTLRLEIRYHR